MRDFFKKEVLDRTYEIFGVRQTDEEKMSDDDIKFLLDGLCQVSKNYAYIPEEDQKNIIRACMLSDKTYRNINLRLVAGWLELNGKKWFTEIAHRESKEPENYKPLEGAERDAMLTMWHNSLRQMNATFTEVTKKSGGSKMREDIFGETTDADNIELQKIREKAAESKKRKREYIAANYDKETGNALETWLPEDEWMKKNFSETLEK